MTGKDDHPMAPAEAHASFLRAVLTLEAGKPAESSPEAATQTDGTLNRVLPTARDVQGTAARRAGRGELRARRKR